MREKSRIHKRLFTINEAATYLARSPWSVRELLWAGKIAYIQDGPGGKIYIDIKDIDNYIDRLKQVFV